jgi:asparagine synthase (glutamine-hydrolysing)
MCGIVGALSAMPVDRELIERMRDRLAHRGPDDAGIWSTEDRRVCLGFRRLAIVDLSPEANQPFLSDDGRHAIVLNGEIYNFRALRDELAATGGTFRTSSDTEVLLEAYRHWGEDCLDRLSGMFAFAIWDEDAGRLFCARDRAGEKPFYYSVVGNSLLFASELKSLLCHRRLPDVRVRPGSEEHLARRSQAAPGTFADGHPSLGRSTRRRADSVLGPRIRSRSVGNGLGTGDPHRTGGVSG